MILRIALSLVFLYFGFQQIISPDDWIGFVPEFATGFGLSANNLVIMNAILEISLGIFLIIGLYTRFSALILSLHLFGIAFSIGLNPLGVRDLGLAVATLVVFINGPDKFTIDARVNRKNQEKKEEDKKEKHKEVDEDK